MYLTAGPLRSEIVGDFNFLLAHLEFLLQTFVAFINRKRQYFCLLACLVETMMQCLQNSPCFLAPPSSLLLKNAPNQRIFFFLLPPLSQVGRGPSLALISHRFEMQGRVGEGEMIGVGWEFGDSFIPCISKADRLLRGGNDW